MNQDFLGKMSDGEKAIGLGSIIVLVSLFLPWYGWDLGPFGSDSVDGFASWGWLTFLGLLGVVVFWALRRLFSQQVELPREMPLSDAAIYMIGGGLEVAGAVLFWLAYHRDVINGIVSVGVKFGTFIAIVGGAITLFGGYLEHSRVATGASGASSAPPPPPGYGAPPPAAPPPPPDSTAV